MPSSPAIANVSLLSNGQFSTLISAAGTGYSQLGDCALTRWQGDPVEDGDGAFIYLRDADSGQFWSIGAQPVAVAGAEYASGASPGLVWLSCTHLGIAARLEIVVSADHDFEWRNLTLHNLSPGARRIEVTSYLEVVLNTRAAEAAHPAFSKLFVQTEYVAAQGIYAALLARRRPRGAGEGSVWLVHAMHGGAGLEYETDRKRFVGRGHDLAAPLALTARTALSGTAGNVLDPAMSLRRTLTLDAYDTGSTGGSRAELGFVLGAAGEREAALALLDHTQRDTSVAQLRLHAAARACGQQGLAGFNDDQACYFQALAAAMLYGAPALRPSAEIQQRAAGNPAILQAYGIPAQATLCVVMAGGAGDATVTTLLAAARYWAALGLNLFLAIVGKPAGWQAFPGKVVLIDPARVPQSDLDTILCLARGVIAQALPPVAARITLPGLTPSMINHATAQTSADTLSTPPTPPTASAPLTFFNGNGGFSADGKEYVVRLRWDGASGLSRPPLPWTNVIANEQVGVLVSESGAGYTWSRNSREHRLTPWSNDPVRDPHGEALYLRDEASGACWSPQPGPLPAAADYEAIHGFGYTIFRHASHGLEQESTVFVPRRDPVKIVRVTLRNVSGRQRRVSLFSYQQLVLGGTPADSGRHVQTALEDGVLLATNLMAGPFADGVTFCAPVTASAVPTHHSADRSSFLGAGGTVARPAALRQPLLDGRNGAGLDPCAAFQLRLDLAPGASVECAFLLGETGDRASALALVRRYRQDGVIRRALDEVRQFWRETTGAIAVKTPVPAIDLMLNGWLAYQNLSCRIWGRSAFYQSGGAIGYRDQLQDASAMIYTKPEMTRRQIRLHAAHQFVEGDVLHWWHAAPLEKGLRTRFSDDLLWLPYVTAFYVKTTGDWGVLDEVEGFLTAPLLEEGEDEVFLQPTPSGHSADVYEHCCRALDRSLTKGAHGLPLMGTGDWNDGMNRVGREGRGESVWMGFFLYRIISDFLPICERRGDLARCTAYRDYHAHLAVVLNDAGWDGQWYRRAYYDNGVPLGSKDSDECQIDALAQAWSVISGVAPPERAAQALDAMEQRLISDRDGLIRLLTPPFVDTPQDPGYIKGYVAGVRENGGQYTHAACWAVRAMAEAGRGERAAQLLTMLSPVSHAMTPEAVATYQVEPYVIAADIYGAAPHVGRGGWTWYTGSAGWMYRVALESVLGFTLDGGDSILLKPVIPADWPAFSIDYRLPDGVTVYAIEVRNPTGGAAQVRSATLDGVPLAIEHGAVRIPLRGGGRHAVDVLLGDA
jgi:cyclic beta-1,2-glucan synthetase